MDPNSVRGYINAVLYDIDWVPDFGEDSGEAFIRRLADSMINQRHFPNSPGEYAEAIKTVVRAGQVPEDSLWISRRYSERELFDFLVRLDRHLDELRPWPRPAFLKLDVARWSEFAQARAIARIDLDIHRLTGVLNRAFDDVVVDGERRPVAILELRSGDLVALLGHAGRAVTAFTLLQHDPGDPAELLARFCEYTRLAPGDASLLAPP